MSVNSVSVKGDESLEKERETMYNEMKQNIERDNLKDRQPDANLTTSPAQVMFLDVLADSLEVKLLLYLT